MKKLIEPEKITQFSSEANIKGRRVLLIGVLFGEPIPRAGLDESESNGFYTSGDRFDENIIGLRFFDNAVHEVIDVKRGDIKAFIGKNQIINASIRTSRPFIVTMLDGGRFDDLPALVNNSVIENKCFVVDNSFPKTPLVVNGYGQSRQLKHSKLIEYRQENVDKFYNL